MASQPPVDPPYMNRAHPWPMPAEALLDVRDELLDDGVAVGAEVRRVHGVRIVVVRVRVLDLDDQEPREARAGPVLVELVGVLLFGPVVARPVEAVAVHGLQVRVGGRLAEAVEVVRKVPVVDDERIPRLRVRVPAFRQQHVRAEEHGPAPELRQEIALDADVLDVLRVRRIGNRRNHLVEDETDGAAPLRVDRQLAAACCRDCPARGSTAGPRHGPSGVSPCGRPRGGRSRSGAAGPARCMCLAGIWSRLATG